MDSRFNRLSAFRCVPWHIVAVLMIIVGLGIWNLASASSNMTNNTLWLTQLKWFGLGTLTCAVVASVDYRKFQSFAWPFYIVVLILLVVVEVTGHAAKGGQRWIDLGLFKLQPSELAQLAVVLMVSRFFHEDSKTKIGYHVWQLWAPGLLMAIPLALVAAQPDLGSAAMVAGAGGSIILVAKIRWKSLLFLTFSFLISTVGLWNFYMREYQKERVYNFLDPSRDSHGNGYHAIQSKIALGSGQMTGKGWGQGTQAQLAFVPEQHTDFVFSVWGEEHGFLGALLVLGLFLILVVMMLQVAATAQDKFGAFMVVGVTAFIFWHMFINIGMVAGVVPVVGITLPFMSYGGSAMISNMVGMGLVFSVAIHRKRY